MNKLFSAPLRNIALCLFLTFSFVQAMKAQTAHLSYTLSTIGSGYNRPTGVALDQSSNVYIADKLNFQVEKLAVSAVGYTQSLVTTSAPGNRYFRTMAIDASGNVYVADVGNSQVLKETLTNGVYTETTLFSSGLNQPNGVAIDAAGNVYIADTGNNRLLKETLSGLSYIESTVDSGLHNPFDVQVDVYGNLYVADLLNNRIVKETPAAGAYTASVVVGVMVHHPSGVAVDAIGNLYVADSGNNRVLKETLSGSSYTQTVLLGGLSYPTSVAVDANGVVYIAGNQDNTVYKLDPNGPANLGNVPVATASSHISLIFTFDTGGTIVAPGVLTQGAPGLDFTDAATGTCTTNGTSHTYNAGDTCTVDVTFTPLQLGGRHGAVQIVDGSNNTLSTAYVYGTGTGPQISFSPGSIIGIGSGFVNPYGTAVDSRGDVFVADFGSNLVQEIVAVNGVVSSGSTVNTIGGIGTFARPESVAVDGAGDVFVADNRNNAVKEIVAVNGVVSSSSTVNTISGGFNSPTGVAVDHAGNVYVADSKNNAVEEIFPVNGVFSSSSAAIAIGSGFASPVDVAVDEVGNVYVADTLHNAIKEIIAVNGTVSSSSTVITIGSGFSYPYGVAVDSSGNVYVADQGHNAIKEILAVNGIVSSSSTVIAIACNSAYALGVAVDGLGNVFVADDGHHTMTKIDLADAPSLKFATTAVGLISSDSPRTVRITNRGDAPLTFELPTSGLNPSLSDYFALDGSSTCPQVTTGSTAATLSAQTSCTAILSFEPTVLGSISGSLVFTDDSLNAVGPTFTTQTIALSGLSTTPPPVPTVAVPTTVLTQSYASATFTPVTASGGTGALSFSISPSLPAGLSYSAAGAVSGNATAVSGTTAYTVTVTDANSVTATATFSLTVNPAIVISTTGVSNVLTVGRASTTFHPVTASDGTGALIFSVSPAFPAGVAFSPAGTVSGTPTAISPTTTYTVTVTDANGATATATISLTVNNALTASKPTLTLRGSPNPAGYGSPVALTAAITGAAGVPTGTVSFYAAGTLVGVAAVDGAGTATCTLSSGLNKETPISAVYSGNSSYLAGASGFMEYVGDPTTTALSVSSASITAGVPVTLTAVVTPNPAMYGYPAAGQVVFNYQQMVNGVARTGFFGPVSLNTSGTASWKFYPGPGTYSIIAAFKGITYETPSNSAPQMVSVAAAALYASVTTLTPAMVSPGNYTLTAGVTAFGQMVPSGLISFFSDSTELLGTATLDPATLQHSLAAAVGSPISFPTQGLNGPDQVTYVVSGDLNGDGIPDLVTGHANDATYLAVQLGVGDGTFGAPIQLTTSYPVNSIAIADVNGDGFPDLIETGAGTGLVYVYFGNGDGTFGAETYATGGQGGGSFVVVTDLNGDGILDLAVAYTNGVLTALGNGDGTFAGSNFLPVPGGNGSEGLAVSDFNHDGVPDMIMSNQGQGMLSLFLGVGDGTFQAPTTIALPDMNPTLLTAADLRHNGTQDVIVTDSVNAAIYVLTGNNDGTFQTAVAYPIGAAGANLALAADVNNDGIPDLVVAGYGPSGGGSLISILRGLGDGTFGTKVDYPTGTGPVSLTLADFNGDGLLDIATADQFTPGETIYLQNQSATASTMNIELSGTGNHSVTAVYPGDASRTGSESAVSVLSNAITASTAITSTVLTQGHPATAITPVTATGGTGTLSYSVSPALPVGLLFATTGAVSGTPSVSSAATTYTVTVTDTDGATTSATFSLAVNAAINASTPIGSTVLTTGLAALAFTPVTATGGTGILSYSVSPILPAGLIFSSTGTVSGTPTAASAATTYTVTVRDVRGTTTTATFSLAVNAAIQTSTAVASSSLTPTYGALVVLRATVTPASADTPPGTASFYAGSTLLGTAALNSTGVATLSTALPLGQDAITAVYSGSASYVGSTSGALAVSNRSSSVVTFSASPTTQLYNNPIVLTAQPTSATAGTLGGTVSFLDGTTVLTTVPLGGNGRATYSIATLLDGSHSLTAAYSGDPNFQPSGSTGAAVAITVGNVNLNLGGDQNQSVVPGSAVAYSFPLSPLVTPTFLYDVHLTATGLPPGATYIFSPAMIPAGSGSLPVTLTVQTAKGTATLRMPAVPGQSSSRGLTALAFGLLLPLLGAKSVRRRLMQMPKPLAMIFFAVLGMGATAGLSGCGNGGFFGATSTSGKYTITVTATSADLVRTSTVQLTIQ